VGQPELDPNVQEMRLKLRARLGVESIDIGSSMGTAFKVRAAVDRGRAVALLVDRAYPEDRVFVPFFGRPTPFLRSPALLARFCGCPILPANSPPILAAAIISARTRSAWRTVSPMSAVGVKI